MNPTGERTPFWSGRSVMITGGGGFSGPAGGLWPGIGFNSINLLPSILPIQGGPLGVYSSHAFTDQVTGFRGPMKRSIGSHVMADRIKTMFEAARKKAAP